MGAAVLCACGGPTIQGIDAWGFAPATWTVPGVYRPLHDDASYGSGTDVSKQLDVQVPTGTKLEIYAFNPFITRVVGGAAPAGDNVENGGPGLPDAITGQFVLYANGAPVVPFERVRTLSPIDFVAPVPLAVVEGGPGQVITMGFEITVAPITPGAWRLCGARLIGRLVPSR